MEYESKVSEGWEFHLVRGKLFITSEDDPDLQIKLDEVAVSDLLEYLHQHQAEVEHNNSK